MDEQYSRVHRDAGQEAVRESGRKLKYSRIRYRRIFLIVTDLLGMGGAPDAPEYIKEKHFQRKHGPNAYYGQGK